MTYCQLFPLPSSAVILGYVASTYVFRKCLSAWRTGSCSPRYFASEALKESESTVDNGSKFSTTYLPIIAFSSVCVKVFVKLEQKHPAVAARTAPCPSQCVRGRCVRLWFVCKLNTASDWLTNSHSTLESQSSSLMRLSRPSLPLAKLKQL